MAEWNWLSNGNKLYRTTELKIKGHKINDSYEVAELFNNYLITLII